MIFKAYVILSGRGESSETGNNGDRNLDPWGSDNS